MCWLITTPRLRIVPASEADRPILERTWSGPSMRIHLGGPLPAERLTERQRMPVSDGTVTVSLASGIIVGFCHFGTYRTGDRELSYVFLPEHWGNGYATEACGALLRVHASDPDPIVAVTQTTNVRSRRVLKKVGMVVVDCFEEWGEMQTMYATVGAELS